MHNSAFIYSKTQQRYAAARHMCAPDRRGAALARTFYDRAGQTITTSELHAAVGTDYNPKRIGTLVYDARKYLGMNITGTAKTGYVLHNVEEFELRDGCVVARDDLTSTHAMSREFHGIVLKKPTSVAEVIENVVLDALDIALASDMIEHDMMATA